MIYTMRQAVLVSAVLLLPLTSFAQFEGKTPVVIHADHDENDTVGRELSYQVREHVKESSRYRLVAAKGKKAIVYSFRIKTTLYSASSPDAGTIYSVVLTLDYGKSQDYLAHSVGRTPAAEVEDTAESLVIQADRVLSRAYKNALEQYGDKGN